MLCSRRLDRTPAGSGFGIAPRAGVEWIQNHSWVQPLTEESDLGQLEDALLRIDHVSERAGILPIVGLNNGAGTAVPPLMATAYNVLSVGRSDGQHSRAGTTNDFTQPGRTKPEIVAPHSATSYSTAVVSSAAALLLDSCLRQPARYVSAMKPKTLKAILLAGATQEDFDGWSNSPGAPLDPVFGAGELNIARSHEILLAAPTINGNAGAGWSYAQAPAFRESRSHTFTIPEGTRATHLTAALCWNRHVTNTARNGSFSPVTSLPNMALALSPSGSGDRQTIATSDASIGNVEFLSFASNLDAGSYTLDVTSDLATPYAIAWIAQTELIEDPIIEMTPALTIDVAGDTLTLTFSGLDNSARYQLEQSTDLLTWQTVTMISADDDSPASKLTIDYTPHANRYYRVALALPEPEEDQQPANVVSVRGKPERRQ